MYVLCNLIEQHVHTKGKISLNYEPTFNDE